ncbi:dehydrodolichyl diphosphate synthase 6-like [Macadamia integrifolia]|uniref:dehydrodolichyl diphosphate synthase 6-like n=1 Tax=Macadamia integrifolia TaxID=60698 RepID=UPI001C4FB872|nr:dehydrodolichyl diphosphate synthase 6-like [Macadamia integrifolia]
MAMTASARSSSGILENLGGFFRKFFFRILSVGPIPTHVAFIMDGNRRYAKKQNLSLEAGYRAGTLSLISILKYCYELRIHYVSIYAFSIDNFRRRPHEVKLVMDLLQEKLQAILDDQTILHSYGIRVLFIGDLKLLNDSLRVLAEEVESATANNNNFVFNICISYTSTNEIVRAVYECCREKKVMENDPIDYNVSVEDLEKHMDMGICPEPDILIRTSGEARLSNFFLWQTTYCYLYSPAALWPEISLRHLVWAVLNFQRIHPYLENQKKKQMKKMKMEKEE